MNSPDLTGAVWRTSSRSNGQYNCVEIAFLGVGAAVRDSKDPWRTSSRSNGQYNCVEIAFLCAAIAVRDSKNPYGPVLSVEPTGLLSAIKVGRLVR